MVPRKILTFNKRSYCGRILLSMEAIGEAQTLFLFANMAVYPFT